MYILPEIIIDEDLSEGVYAASGSECYTTTARIHQTPETGRGDYRIQVDAKHGATDGHTNDAQTLTLSFNQEVTYVWSSGTLKGSGTGSVIQIDYSYHQNATDNIGLGDVVVTSDEGLAITGAAMSDGH